MGPGRASILLGVRWLILLAVGTLAIAFIYVPLMGPSLRGIDVWMVALWTTILAALSLLAHARAHRWAARATGSQRPPFLLLLPFGDVAHLWPAAPTPLREALVAMAGPIVNLVLAGVTYLIWEAQLHPALNVGMSLLAIANLGIAIINLAPGFPLDGGRLVRALLWGLYARPDLASRLPTLLGLLMVVSLALWGIILLSQPVRFSHETGLSTLFAAALLGLPLLMRRARNGEDEPGVRCRLARAPIMRGLLAGLVICALLVGPISLVPTLNGMQTPGFAIPVEPMVTVPPSLYHAPRGNFILTTVIAQAPILTGQWAYAQVDPATILVAPERLVPPDITPQELIARNYRLLDESTLTAMAVALRLAGYDARIIGEAVEVVSVLPESPAQGLLQPGDRIVGLNGMPITMASELINDLRSLRQATTVDLSIRRGNQELRLTVPVMQPRTPDEPPRVGISIQTVGFDVVLPFEVHVEPQRIIGGPSAGLMFTLTIYNMLTPEDLTGGLLIAGTGTITVDGHVGPIGGVEQKVVGAERAGAAYFLVPPENYEEARRVARHIQVVRVATVQEALVFLQALAAPAP